MKHIVIGIAGHKGAGKNTVATIIERLVSPGTAVRQYAFAGAVRNACAFIFGYEKVWWDDAQKEVPQDFLGGHTPRYYMRQVAQSIRAEDPDFWSFTVQRRITTAQESLNHLPGTCIHLVTDLRFENEWNVLFSRFRFTELWLIDRGGSSDGHPSEELDWINKYTASTNFYTIKNDGTLEDLEANVKLALDLTQSR